MNKRILKPTIVTATLLGLAAVLLLQEQRAKRLIAESDVLRKQVEESVAVRQENRRLADQLRDATKRLESDTRELAQLRGKSVRMQQLEEEHSRLKMEHDRSGVQRVQSDPVVEDDQTPEWPLVGTRMHLSKVVGLEVIVSAYENDGQMPTNIVLNLTSRALQRSTESLVEQFGAEVVARELRPEQFELVFHGNLNSTGRERGKTMIARSTEPVQLSNGRWARSCVFDDGHAEILVADTASGLAAKEETVTVTLPTQ